MKRKITTNLIIFILIFFLGVASFVFLDNKKEVKPNSGKKSQESTDREVENSWKEFQIESIKFQAPEKLKEKYVSLQKWPPEIKFVIDKNKWPTDLEIRNGKLNCQETSKEDSFPERVYKKNVNERTYCIKATSEGAAGSTYTEYNYLTIYKDKLVSIGFILQFPNCSNYPEAQRTECSNERENFDIGDVINQTVESITFVSKSSYLEKVITDFLLNKKDFSWKTGPNTKNFCVIDNLSKDNDFPIYAWVRCGEFIKENQELKEESGCSLPVKVNYSGEFPYFNINKFAYEIPRDGKDWGKDVREIFPNYVQEKIFNYQKESIDKINKELRSMASIWFELE